MQKYGVNELRRMFLEFFESKGHLAMKSFSLVPHNDNSLLLINSGMAPLKPYFTHRLPAVRSGGGLFCGYDRNQLPQSLRLAARTLHS